MKVLVINTGSSSIKYSLFDMDAEETLAAGLVERIGEQGGRVVYNSPGAGGAHMVKERDVPDHQEGMALIQELLAGPDAGVIQDPSEVHAVGHRVVHGGEDFQDPELIDEQVINAIEKNARLAPLHNPANLTGIRAAQKLFPAAPQVAVFDTAFHQTVPPMAFHYGLPYEFYKTHKIRRYGFHGTSHQYVAEQAANYLGKPIEKLNLITVHLGNGASITAIRAGKSVDTSMGMTPLEGLVMGTRCGDLDPAIYFYLAEHFQMTIPEIESLLNKKSGLKGICGSNDMREILEKRSVGDQMAGLALDIYAYRIRKYVGAYMAVLGRVQAIVFTAGIGENAAEVRAEALSGMESLGVSIDPERNMNREGETFEISAGHSPVKVLVIPTNEEMAIARHTLDKVKKK